MLTIFLFIVGSISIFYLMAKKSIVIRKRFSYVAIFVLTVYLVWRALFTLPFYSIISFSFGLLLFLAELVGLIVFMIFIFLFRKQADKIEEPTNGNNYYPSVSVFVCTYNEDMKLVIATALAAKMLSYQNKEVYICDDGHRAELEVLCDKFELKYITRDNNIHGKAGNINNALSQTESDLFMILDADFIVKQNFIKEAIPYFADESVALIQYPQTFYNKDPFQLMRKSFYNEQELFMRFLEPELAKENAMIHIGTNAILRRTAVEKIGGIPTKSITEDMATGILLQNVGFKTVYINKAYALGVTPYTVDDLAKQRERWAKGTMQIFKNYKPLRMKGLSKIQKICYFNAYLYWYTSFQKMIYILAPTVFMVFNIFVVRSDVTNLFVFFLPPMLMILLCFRLYIPNIRTLAVSHIYDTFVAPIHAKAIIKEFFKSEKKFRVTNKELSKESKYDFKTVSIHIILFIWVLFSCVIAIIKIVDGNNFLYGYIITLAWSIYNLYGLAHSIAAAKTRDIISDADALSIKIDEDVSYNEIYFNVFQMSFNGCRMRQKSKDKRINLEVGKVYNFKVARTGLEVSAECKLIDDIILFEFKNLTTDAANRLAIYYSEKLHAPKEVNLK